MDTGQLEGRKARVKAWFERLRGDICAALEALEGAAPAALHGDLTGRFVRTPWTRTDTTGAASGGGGVGGVAGRPVVGSGGASSTRVSGGGPGVRRRAPARR